MRFNASTGSREGSLLRVKRAIASSLFITLWFMPLDCGAEDRKAAHLEQLTCRSAGFRKNEQ